MVGERDVHGSGGGGQGAGGELQLRHWGRPARRARAPDPEAGEALELAAGAGELLAAADEVAAGGADDEDEDDPQAVTLRAVMIRTATAAIRGTGPSLT